MKLKLSTSLAALTLTLACAASTRAQDAARQQGQTRERPPAPAPTHANVRYGPHERNVIDLYLAASDKPAPLVLYIHGGGFKSGDKNTINSDVLRSFAARGVSMAAINYRLTDAAPMPAAYLDCARALQFLRHNAKKWNIDPKLVASTGGSAGAGTSLWIAFHDDLADPNSDDPIARQSTRLICAATTSGQCSYDPRFLEKLGAKRPNFERHSFFEPFYGIKVSEADTPKAYKLYEQAAPITCLTSDDPPVMMSYGRVYEPVTEETSLSDVVHYPGFGVKLKEEMEKLGLECLVVYRDAKTRKNVEHGAPDKSPLNSVEFIMKQFEKARR